MGLRCGYVIFAVKFAEKKYMFDILCTLAVITCDVSVEEVKAEIIRQAVISAVPEDVALRIGQCESSYKVDARNPNSSATGVYQFTSGTWEYIKAEGRREDYKENIKQFLIYYPRHKNWWKDCLLK